MTYTNHPQQVQSQPAVFTQPVYATVAMVSKRVDVQKVGSNGKWATRGVKFTSDNGQGLPKDNGATLWCNINVDKIHQYFKGQKVLLSPKPGNRPGTNKWEITILPDQAVATAPPAQAAAVPAPVTAPAPATMPTAPTGVSTGKILSQDERDGMRAYAKQQAELLLFCRQTVMATFSKAGLEVPEETIRAHTSGAYISTCKAFGLEVPQ